MTGTLSRTPLPRALDRRRPPRWPPRTSSVLSPQGGSNSVCRTTGCRASTRWWEKICTDWGRQNNVDVGVDFITSVGNKLALTAQAEARAGTGHDIFQMGLWGPSIQRTKLEPLDEVIADIEADVGPMDPAARYCFYIDGAWRSSPVAVMGQTHACNKPDRPFPRYRRHRSARHLPGWPARSPKSRDLDLRHSAGRRAETAWHAGVGVRRRAVADGGRHVLAGTPVRSVRLGSGQR